MHLHRCECGTPLVELSPQTRLEPAEYGCPSCDFDADSGDVVERLDGEDRAYREAVQRDEAGVL